VAIAYVNRNGAVGQAVQLTGVTSGNLIVCMIQWQDSATAPTLSDGTNVPDGYATVVNNANKELVRFAYWLSSPKSGTVTYTWTASGGGHTAHVFEMSGGTWAVEHIDAGATAGGETATSGSETSSNASMVAFGGAGWYNTETYSSATIDGVSVDQYVDLNDNSYGTHGTMTMKILNNPGTYNSAITVTGTYQDYAADLIAFSATAGGASGISISVSDTFSFSESLD
jgi:hypothetical protein